MKKYCVKIFGCQMNYADAERVIAVLEKAGWQKVENEKNADAILLVTCSVRQKAEDKVFGFLKEYAKWKQKKPGRKVGLTGCMVRRTSNRDSEKKDALLRRAEALDFVWRIEDSAQLPKLLDCRDAPPGRLYFSIEPKHSNPAQTFVPIMTGCDNFCSYCIVPYARGREVSRDMEEILAECEKAVKNGALEITLLGQNVNSYQKKKGAFAELLDKVAQIPGLKRLRFTSSHPKDFDESVIDVMAKHENIERHLHLPAQHGDNEVLKAMNRNYTVAHYLKLIEKFRAKLPEASVTTDLIVGFPGESEKAFENLLNFYREADFDFAYFAKYSPRPGTAAAKLADDVSRETKSERWNKLNETLIATTEKKYAKLKDKTLEILVENCTPCHSRAGGNPKLKSSAASICEGRSSEFYLVKFEGSTDLIGKIVKVKITQPREVELWGEI